jgi:hypothetical protein
MASGVSSPTASPLDIRPLPPPPSGRSGWNRYLWPWLALAALLVTIRAALFVLHPTLAFDADQALVGLMAKHIAEGRAFPVFYYSLPYTLMMLAWVSAPLVWLLGAVPATIKLPLLVINVGVGVWLVRQIAIAGVRPSIALAVSLPFLIPAPITASGLMDALGMTVEPFAFVAALWLVRHRPIALGVVAAIGFHVREFVAYAVAAIWLVDMVSARGPGREAVRHWTLALVAGLLTRAGIDALTRFGSPAGPGTWLPADGRDNVAYLMGAFCFAPTAALTNLGTMATRYAGLLWGAVPAPVSDGAVQTAVWQGAPWLWPLLATTIVIVMVRVLTYARALSERRQEPALTLALYLGAIGVQALVVYAVSRCGALDVVTIRYALLGVLLPVGLVLAWWTVEGRAGLRAGVLLVLVLMGAVNLTGHVRLWREQSAEPRQSNRALLARALEARGIRYARSDYWTAYYVTYLTQERVIVGPTSSMRVEIYERELARQPQPLPVISGVPCGDEPAIVPGYYVCQ